MKEIIIEKKDTLYYNPVQSSMLFVDEVLSDTRMSSYNSITCCREVFIKHFITRLEKQRPLLKKDNTDFSKLRVVFCLTTIPEEKIKNCLRILHNFEESHGIPQTEISKALVYKHKLPKIGVDKQEIAEIIPTTYLFEGSDIWLRSSVLISLYLLIIRTSLKDYTILIKNNINTVNDLYNLISNNQKEEIIYDTVNIKNNIRYWNMIIANRDLLFPKRKKLIDCYLAKHIYSKKPYPINDAWKALVSTFGIRSLIESNNVYKHSKYFESYRIFHSEFNEDGGIVKTN